MPARRYSDEERATALAALVANGGNVARTARQLAIPAETLRKWSKGERHPESTQMGEQKKGPLADAIEAVANQLLGDLSDEAKRSQASLKDIATAFGIAVDKMQLLRGRATSIQQHDLSHLSDDELDRRIAEQERELLPFAGGEAAAAGP